MGVAELDQFGKRIGHGRVILLGQPHRLFGRAFQVQKVEGGAPGLQAEKGGQGETGDEQRAK